MHIVGPHFNSRSTHSLSYQHNILDFLSLILQTRQDKTVDHHHTTCFDNHLSHCTDILQPSCCRYPSSESLFLETRLQKPHQAQSHLPSLDTPIFYICLKQSERSTQPTCNDPRHHLHVPFVQSPPPDPRLSHKHQPPHTTPQD